MFTDAKRSPRCRTKSAARPKRCSLIFLHARPVFSSPPGCAACPSWCSPLEPPQPRLASPVSAARNPHLSFAALLGLPLKTLKDQETFAASGPGPPPRRGQATTAAAGPAASRNATTRAAATPNRLAKAAFRQGTPAHAHRVLGRPVLPRGPGVSAPLRRGIRWRRFRLLAVDGTRLECAGLPGLARATSARPATPRANQTPKARLVLVQFPLARAAVRLRGGAGRGRRADPGPAVAPGLCADDLVLLDAGFLCYGLLCQVDQQGASFCLRLHRALNLHVLKELGSANDVLVEWTPKDSRGQWRKEGLPASLTLRLLTYQVAGFRPLRLLTNVPVRAGRAVRGLVGAQRVGAGGGPEQRNLQLEMGNRDHVPGSSRSSSNWTGPCAAGRRTGSTTRWLATSCTTCW